MASEKDAGEDLPLQRRRLRYRAWHRGTKEMDLLLGPYADARLDGMDGAGLARFATLMDEADTDLQKWMLGQEPPPADVDRALIAEILAFRMGKHV